MSKIMQDPLLSFSRLLLIALIGIFIFSIVMVVIGIGAMLTIDRADILTELVDVELADSLYWWVIGLMTMAIGMLSLGLRFVMELRGIVLSVKDGDPFQEKNASRLSCMGWLSVAGYALSIPMGIIGEHLSDLSGYGGTNDFVVGFGSSGILLILTLFILARVFRTGTQMRDDLEGTV